MEDSVRVFVVGRLGRESLVLDSLPVVLGRKRDSARGMAGSPGPALECRVRTLPGAAEDARIRRAVAASIEGALGVWILERTFTGRVALSAGAFLVVYLFLSIVVRDPLPLLDELVAGCIGAAVVWAASRTRALASPRVGELSTRLKEALDRMGYSESPVVAWTEDRLSELVSATDPQYAEGGVAAGNGGTGFDLRAWISRDSPGLEPPDGAELAEMRDALVWRLYKAVPETHSALAFREARSRRILGMRGPLDAFRPARRPDGDERLHALFLKIQSTLESGNFGCPTSSNEV